MHKIDKTNLKQETKKREEILSKRKNKGLTKEERKFLGTVSFSNVPRPASARPHYQTEDKEKPERPRSSRIAKYNQPKRTHTYYHFYKNIVPDTDTVK